MNWINIDDPRFWAMIAILEAIAIMLLVLGVASCR